MRCGIFRFLSVHNVCEMNIDAYLDPRYGIYEYLKKQKENGRIRHLGFSAHGSYEVMKRFLAAYGKDMEFCQIQLNYLDWSFQDAKKENGASGGIRHSAMGYGAFKRRPSGIFGRGGRRKS